MDLIDDINQTIDIKTQQLGGNRNTNKVKNKRNGKKRVKSIKNKKRGSKMLSKHRKQSHNNSIKNKTIKSNKLWWLRRRGCV